MNIKNLIAIFIICFIYQISISMVPQGTQLSQFNYNGASLLPVTSWPNKPTNYVLLSEEAHGTDKGTFDDFGGDREAGETHPLITASREAWEESVNLLLDSQKNLRDYIDLKTGNTDHIVVSIDKSLVTYVTNFNHMDMEKLTRNFYTKLAQTTDRKLKEKSRLAWVKYDDLKNIVANAKRDNQGRLITPITVNADIVNPKDPSLKAQIKSQITLRPVFVSKLQEFFKDSPYVEGANPKIKFYKRGYVPLVPIKPEPITQTKPSKKNNIENLQFLSATLNSLSTRLS